MSLQWYVVCVCGGGGGRIWSTGYLHYNQVCTFMHMYVLCENSDSVRNKNPKSQVVLCVCAHVCMCVHSCTCTLCKNSASGTSPVCVCVYVHVCVHMCVHSCTFTLCKDSVRNKNPKCKRYKLTD